MSLPLPSFPNHSSPALSSSHSSSTMTPTPSTYQQQNNLRVNTDFHNSTNSRLRSNSALSPRPTPDSLSPINTNLGGGSGMHGSSRSLGSSLNDYTSSTGKGDGISVSQLSSVLDEEDKNDVILAIRGLRGGGSSPSPSTSRTPSHNGKIRNGAINSPVSSGANQNGNGPPPTEEFILNKINDIAQNSKDEGDTLDISRQNMNKISDKMVDLFIRGVGKNKRGVWRLALSYNGLTNDSIADSFSSLSRLRYLNLKGNYLTEFPKPITEIASLEILDLSKNKISGFPEQPGRLNKLKVLSLTNNKIYTLPGYMVDFTSLKVFKVDQNPVEWPPKEVLGPLAESADPSRSKNTEASSMNGGKDRKDEDLRPWIENMKSWMRQRAVESERLLQQAEDMNRVIDDEPLSATSMTTSVSARSFDSQMGSPKVTFPAQETVKRAALTYQYDNAQPHTPTRPYIAGRDRSATLSDDALARSFSPGPSQYSPYRPRHNREQSSSSFTSPPSASTESSAHSRMPSGSLPHPPVLPTGQGHSRGASYTTTQRLSGNLTVKKSLPDLRQSHAQIIQDRRNEGQSTEENRPLGLGIAAPGVPKFQLPGRGWAGDMMRSPTDGPTLSGHERSRVMNRKGSIEMIRRTSGDMSAQVAEKRNSQDGPQIDESKNSYFRRLSTLPVSTISKTIPAALLKFIDAVRGILYALSQLHSALRQYLVFAVNERIASVFSRVMEPAGNYMNNLINALDRFDSMSRRNTPPVHAIRSVIEAAKESVAVFAKVMAVLRMQIPALKSNDVRYTRTLLTMIYGSMAEVACSWRNMAPLLVEIRPLLVIDVGGLAMRSLGGVKMAPTASLSGRTPISPIIERRESQSPASVSKSTVGGSPLVPQVEESPAPASTNAASLRTMGRTRRQAGSFSSLDVEKGMLMGSPGGTKAAELATDQLSTPGSYLRHRPSESATIVLDQQAEESEDEIEAPPPPPFPVSTTSPNGTPFTVPGTPPDVMPSHHPIAMVPTHSRQGNHHPSSSSGSSHALSFATGNPPPPTRKLSVDVRPPTPSSASVFDEDLLDVIETATDIAFTCWLKLAEDVGASSPPFSNGPTIHQKSGSQSSILSNAESARLGHHPFTPIDNPRRPPTISLKHHSELLHLLSIAEQTTAGLRESLMGLRANPTTYTTTTLSDDAQAFIKTVVQVSVLVKTISATHNFPMNVRQACSRLTQSTRECAILIQVSSLRPTSSTPSGITMGIPMSANNTNSRPLSPMYPSSRSQEDLGIIPHSAGYNNSTMSTPWDPNHNQREGLRGLQLPSRQMALGRNRSANPVPPINGNTNNTTMQNQNQNRYGDHPRSAQPSQVAF
ncbi:uncharacterized protein IL334_004249 [Kwoniella shivajii]|uniref:Disease resistance R13L4/SHOC-2-like LRR domain-containing protein n=1 Tax=Kwoniella shivajii TaxID=564305 RepID=A0ABZ1CZT9_9TREE|nr:hypothetical protein IL334_004249 [Kwoniella shivajii]